jgi:hypothetical protein
MQIWRSALLGIIAGSPTSLNVDSISVISERCFDELEISRLRLDQHKSTNRRQRFHDFHEHSDMDGSGGVKEHKNRRFEAGITGASLVSGNNVAYAAGVWIGTGVAIAKIRSRLGLGKS